MEADSDEDEHINDIEGGSQPSGDLDIPSLKADVPKVQHADIPHAEVPPAMDESPLFEVRAQIINIAARMKELVVVDS